MAHRIVVLHGHLKRFHEGPIRIVARTAAEAVEAVSRQLFPTRQRVKVVGCETEEDLFRDLGDQIEIHIVPQLNGGKRGGLLQILLGVALVAIGFFIGPATWLGSMVMKVGAIAVLGGLAQILAPQPEDDKEQDRSRYLGAPRNTVQIGTRIPILYGKRRVWGHYLAFDINAKDYSKRATTSGGGGK
mgnify:CR=1 FL=1